MFRELSPSTFDVLELPKQVPMTVDRGNKLGTPWIRAKTAIVRRLLAKGDVGGALSASRSGEQPGGVSREEVDELRRAIDEVERRRRGERERGYGYGR